VTIYFYGRAYKGVGGASTGPEFILHNIIIILILRTLVIKPSTTK